jgi:transposase
MPAPLRITLTEEEDRTLSELRQAQSVPYRTRDRAHMLRLNAQGMNVPAIAEVFQCHQQTVRAILKRWQQHGLGGLWEAPGRGAKAKWQPADLDYLTDCLAQEQRTYNSGAPRKIESFHVNSARKAESASNQRQSGQEG